MPPLLCFAWTLVSVFAILLLADIAKLAAFSLILLLLSTFVVPVSTTIKIATKWVLPFTVPLLILHGIVNPGFAVTNYLGEIVPFRLEGVEYGGLVSIRILIITIIAAFWYQIPRDALIDTLAVWKVPAALVVISAQAISTMDYIRRKAASVYLAQRARGIPVGPSIVARAKALSTIVVPVVVSALIDANTKATILHVRGLGSSRIAVRTGKEVSVMEIILSLLLIAGLFYLWMML